MSLTAAAYSEDKNEDGSTVYRCHRCNKTFVHRGMMNRHLKVHNRTTETEHVSCTLCGRTFFYQSSLTRHRQKVHSTKLAFGCRICKRRYRYKSSLDHHMLVHNDSRPHECEICGKTCRTKYKLSEHMLVHTVRDTNGRIRCSRGCGLEFPSLATWLKHHQEQPLCTLTAAINEHNNPNNLLPIPEAAPSRARLIGPNLVTISTI